MLDSMSARLRSYVDSLRLGDLSDWRCSGRTLDRPFYGSCVLPSNNLEELLSATKYRPP